MKKIIFLFSVVFLSLVYANTIKPDNTQLAWVNQQVDAISQPRNGISSIYINTLKNPFVFIYKIKQIGKRNHHAYITRSWRRHFRTLKLTLIINHQALINGRWYKLHKRLRGFKISFIGNHQVILKRGHVIKKLSVQRDNKNIKINIK